MYKIRLPTKEIYYDRFFIFFNLLLIDLIFIIIFVIKGD